MNATFRFDWRSALNTGLLGGGTALFLALVGLLEAADRRPIIPGTLSMGQTLVLITLVFSAFLTVRRVRAEQEQEVPRAWLVAGAALAGLVTNGFLAALVLLGGLVNLRTVFANASPVLYDLLTLELSTGLGLVMLLLIGAGVGAAMAAILTMADSVPEVHSPGLERGSYHRHPE